MKTYFQLQRSLGQRVSQEVSSVVTEYLLDMQPGLWKVIAADDGSVVNRYIHDLVTGRILQHEDPSGGWNWPALDGLGTVRGVYDDTLAEVYVADRDPYGDLIASTGSNPTPFEYTGEPEDPNGLLHLRARYYDPGLGVFNSLDPVETANRYAYAGANPINNTDPSGLTYVPPIPSFGCPSQDLPHCIQYPEGSCEKACCIAALSPSYPGDMGSCVRRNCLHPEPEPLPSLDECVTEANRSSAMLLIPEEPGSSGREIVRAMRIRDCYAERGLPYPECDIFDFYGLDRAIYGERYRSIGAAWSFTNYNRIGGGITLYRMSPIDEAGGFSLDREYAVYLGVQFGLGVGSSAELPSTDNIGMDEFLEMMSGQALMSEAPYDEFGGCGVGLAGSLFVFGIGTWMSLDGLCNSTETGSFTLDASANAGISGYGEIIAQIRDHNGIVSKEQFVRNCQGCSVIPTETCESVLSNLWELIN